MEDLVPMSIVAEADLQDAGNVIDLAAVRRRRRHQHVGDGPRLSSAEVRAFSAAIRAVEPRSVEYWRIWTLYLRASGELG